MQSFSLLQNKSSLYVFILEHKNQLGCAKRFFRIPTFLEHEELGTDPKKQRMSTHEYSHHFLLSFFICTLISWYFGKIRVCG